MTPGSHPQGGRNRRFGGVAAKEASRPPLSPVLVLLVNSYAARYSSW
jgi:hypothetical protein